MKDPLIPNPGVGPGNWSCRCCRPNTGDKKIHRRYIRAKIKTMVAKLMKKDLL